MLAPTRVTALRALTPCAAPSVMRLATTPTPPMRQLATSLYAHPTPCAPPSPIAARFRSTLSPGAPPPSQTPPSFSSSSATTPPPPPPTTPLDWNRFFRLRTIRRRYQVGFSVVGGVAGTGLGIGLIVTGVCEPLVADVPLDPMVSMGIIALSCGALGWLAGPAFGTVLFNLIHRGRFKAQMMARESEFYARIKSHRVDPSSSSAQNPVPDFYGERISSVQGYRQWLRDQRAFNKKRRTFV